MYLLFFMATPLDYYSHLCTVSPQILSLSIFILADDKVTVKKEKHLVDQNKKNV